MCCQMSASICHPCDFLANIDRRSGSVIGLIAYVTEGAGSVIGHVSQKTVAFVKRNWRQIISYFFAWGTIIACTGLMYGFQAVSLPLTIGMGCGVAFGLITGILTVKVFPSGRVTPWNLLNNGIGQLDPNGTRQIVLSVAVTVVLAASVVFPYVLGALFGIFIGIQIATKIGVNGDLGQDPDDDKSEKESLKRQMEEMQKKLVEMNIKLHNIESASEKEKLALEMSQMFHKLHDMHGSLERSYPSSTPPATPLKTAEPTSKV